jgi:plastocyanin
MRRKAVLLSGILTAGFLAAACGGPDPTATPIPPSSTPTTTTVPPTPTSAPARSDPEDGSVQALDIANFTLPTLTVAVGARIEWTNRDGVPHTTTAGAPGALTGDWDSGRLQQGGSFGFTFTQEGDFAYFCTVHPTMLGTITVASGEIPAGSAGSSPEAAPVEPPLDY